MSVYRICSQTCVSMCESALPYISSLNWGKTAYMSSLALTVLNSIIAGQNVKQIIRRRGNFKVEYFNRLLFSSACLFISTGVNQKIASTFPGPYILNGAGLVSVLTASFFKGLLTPSDEFLIFT